MNQELWPKVEELFHAALERAPETREAFLNEACHEDAELRGYVESLLRNGEEAGSFLEKTVTVTSGPFLGRQMSRMTAKRWTQLKRIFEAAQSKPLPERAEVVGALAEGDEELELAVRALLAADESAGSFLQTPATDLHSPVLAAGVRLGPYQILGLLGEGGMGKVYRGLDTRLGRAVAIKISAEQFSKRFEGGGARHIGAQPSEHLHALRCRPQLPGDRVGGRRNLARLA